MSFSIGSTHAAEIEELNPKAINKVLDKAERELKRKNIRVLKLKDYFDTIKTYRTWALSCVDKKKTSEAIVSEKILVLGDKVVGESSNVSKKRTALLNQSDNIKKELASCKVILLRSDEFSNKVNLVKQTLLAQQILAHGPGFFELLAENWDNPSLWTDAVKTFVLEHSGLLDIKITNVILLIFFLIILHFVSRSFYNKLSNWSKNNSPQPSLASQLTCSLVNTIIRYIMFVPAILFSVAFVNLTNLDVIPTPFIVIVFNGLAIVVSLNLIIHFFLNSSLSIFKYEPEAKVKATNIVHRLKVLVFIIFFGYLLFSTLLFHGLSEVVLYMSRGLYGFLLVLNLVWIIWLLGYFHKLGNQLTVRMALTLVFISALVAEWLGYRNLSLYIIEVVLGTLILIGIYAVISKLISEFMDSLDKGNIAYALKFRNWLGIHDDEKINGLIWIRIIITLVMWIAFVSLIIIIWQIPDSYTELLLVKIIEGISIGSFKLIPLQLFESIVVFSFILLMSSWFKRRLEKNWLPKTSLTRSARESMATISGYVGVLIALIIALSFIGMDFSKLALVAGALSVGIGFGLQNVVNNFISGLILLFERPIKTGDWIIVGETEGHVKRISIRSTLIQTFDRADVIVPNSEIISGTVTNLMLRDHSGRLRVPIGVAYGSDTEFVRDLLLQVANEHSDVIKGNSIIADPNVFFMAFGDSSLDFELRCYIYNIDNRRATISDLNFAIDKIFRINNITIPFPQRDIHILKQPKDTDSGSDS